MTIATGTAAIAVLPLFVWPDTRDDTMSGLYFYGAMLQPDFSNILGSWDAVEFGIRAVVSPVYLFSGFKFAWAVHLHPFSV